MEELSESKLLNWVSKVREEILFFLSTMEIKNLPGAYRYSYNADIFPVTRGKHGLANTVFAVKIMQTIGAQEILENKKNVLTSFLLTFFNKRNFEITDPSIRLLSLPKRIISRFGNNALKYNEIRRAETRQSYAALLALNRVPLNKYMSTYFSDEAIAKFFRSLNWRNPWGAASQLSHLTFFMRLHNQLGNLSNVRFNELSTLVLQLLDTIQNKDGSWGINIGKLQINRKINGIMKVMLALDMLRPKEINRLDNILKLADESLKTSYGACDNMDIIFVYNRCARYLNFNSIKEKLEKVCFQQLTIFKKHYHENLKGFSFYINRCNTYYFGAPIAFPKNVPDIHGTLLYLWSISLILELLGLSDEYGFKEPIT